MKQDNSPYVKPTVTFHPTNSAEYDRLKALLDAEHERVKREQSIDMQGRPRDVSP